MMPSPFPGVDPYLEDQGLWADFHNEFITAWRWSLLERLPSDYDARLDENVYIVHEHREPGKLILPDVALERLPDPLPGGRGEDAPDLLETGAGTATMTLPIAYQARESYIRIEKHPERTLVAVLELLSPTNKGSERQTYLRKRDEVLAGTAHLVELDLLVRGQRLPVREPLPPASCYAFVTRGDNKPFCQVIWWGLRNPLPTIPIPLAEPDAHVLIDLAEVFRAAWHHGRYERVIDYSKPLTLPLPEQDLQWIRQQLSAG